MNLKNFVRTVAFGLAIAVSGASFAQSTGGGGAIDTSGVVSAVQSAGSAAGVVGAAVLVMMAGIAAYRWIRRAM